MGVNANFAADFSTFLSAIDAADVKLADFGRGAETVETKLNNMVDKFSGRALIQQANELVVAIDKVGGATALTTAEQARLNATLEQAIEKYHVIGEEVPPEMQALADETKQVHSGTDELMSTLGELAGAFGIAFSVEAIVRFTEQLFEGARELRNLSLQTNISIEDLQVLKTATAEYGVEGQQLGRALFQLQQRINGGDQSVVAAYAMMGLTLDQIKDKNPMDLFLTTEHALGTLDSRLQSVAAKDLFGGRLGASMIAFSAQSDEAIEKARQINIATDASVKQMAEYADTIERTKTSLMNWATEGVGGALGGIENLNKAMGQGGSSLKIFAAGWMDWAQTQITGVQHAEHLAKVFDDLNQKTVTNTAAQHENTASHKEAGKALSDQATAEEFLHTIQENANKPLLAWQKEYLDHLQAIGQLTAQNAMVAKINADQLEVYKKGLEATKKAAEDLAKAEKEADAIAMESYTKRAKSLTDLTNQSLKAYDFHGQIAQLEALKASEEALARSVYDQLNSEKDRMKVLEDMLARRQAIDAQEAALQQKQAQRVNAAVVDEVTAQAKIMAAYGQNVDGTQKVESAQMKLQVALDALHAKKQEGVSQYYQEQELMDQFLKDQEAETAATDKATTAQKAKKQATDEHAQAVQALHGQLTMLVSDPAIAQYFGALDSGLASVARTIAAGGKYSPGEAAYIAGGGIISGPIGGGTTFRASGGPVSAGAPYIVGEQGPELFVPSSAGNIVPNGSGGVGVTININGSVLGTPNEIARVVGGAVMNLLRSQGTRLPVGP